MKYQRDLDITVYKDYLNGELTFNFPSTDPPITTIDVELSTNPAISSLTTFRTTPVDAIPVIGLVMFLSSQDSQYVVQENENIYIGTSYINTSGVSDITLSALNDNYIVTACLIPMYDRTTVFTFNQSSLCIYDGNIYKSKSVSSINSSGVYFDPLNWTLLSLSNISDVDYVLDWCVAHKEFEVEFDNHVLINVIRTNDNEMEYEISAVANFTMSSPLIDFGDGNTSSTTSASNEYVTEGSKTIQFTCLDLYGNSFSVYEVIDVQKVVIPAFSFKFNSTDKRQYQFTNESKGDTSSTYLWDFGDGTISTNENPIHTYDESLDETNITVTLSIVKSGITYSTTATVYIGYTDCKVLYESEYYTSACHEFVTVEKDNTGVDRKLYLYDYLGNLISSHEMASGDEELSFSVVSDGVYIAKLWTLDVDGNDDTLIKEFPVYTFCNAEECYYKIVEALLCCDTYCEDPCDLEAKELIYKMRNGLTRINSVLGLINKYVYLERNKYLGTIIIDATRRDYIYRVSKLQELLATTVNRCGECLENMPDTGECQTCNS